MHASQVVASMWCLHSQTHHRICELISMGRVHIKKLNSVYPTLVTFTSTKKDPGLYLPHEENSRVNVISIHRNVCIILP